MPFMTTLLESGPLPCHDLVTGGEHNYIRFAVFRRGVNKSQDIFTNALLARTEWFKHNTPWSNMFAAQYKKVVFVLCSLTD